MQYQPKNTTVLVLDLQGAHAQHWLLWPHMSRVATCQIIRELFSLQKYCTTHGKQTCTRLSSLKLHHLASMCSKEVADRAAPPFSSYQLLSCLSPPPPTQVWNPGSLAGPESTTEVAHYDINHIRTCAMVLAWNATVQDVHHDGESVQPIKFRSGWGISPTPPEFYGFCPVAGIAFFILMMQGCSSSLLR